MAFSTSIQQPEKPVPAQQTVPSTDATDALFSVLLLSMYGAQMSKKTVRKLKRKFFWTSLKLKFKSLFKPFSKSPAGSVSDRQLLYIIAAAVFIALLFVNWIAALVIAFFVLVLILAGVI